jgi:hypothetical protein
MYVFAPPFVDSSSLNACIGLAALEEIAVAPELQRRTIGARLFLQVHGLAAQQRWNVLAFVPQAGRSF